MHKVVELLAQNHSLTEKDKVILQKNTRQLSRAERNYYFQQLKPREREFKAYLKEVVYDSHREHIKNTVVNNLLQNRGDPCIADSMVMDILGRLEVYRELRKKAGEQGIQLNALTNFGGMGMIIGLVGLISALILYLLNH